MLYTNETYNCKQTHTYIYMYVCVCVFVCVCVCIYIYIYIHTHTQPRTILRTCVQLFMLNLGTRVSGCFLFIH